MHFVHRYRTYITKYIRTRKLSNRVIFGIRKSFLLNDFLVTP